MLNIRSNGMQCKDNADVFPASPVFYASLLSFHYIILNLSLLKHCFVPVLYSFFFVHQNLKFEILGNIILCHVLTSSIFMQIALHFHFFGGLQTLFFLPSTCISFVTFSDSQIPASCHPSLGEKRPRPSIPETDADN